MVTATANGKKFTFPEGTTPQQMGQAIDEYFASQGPARQPDQEAQPGLPERALTTLSNAAGEVAAGVNRGVVDAADFALNSLNVIPQALGSDARLPTLRSATDKIGVTQGGFVKNDLARNILGTAGETISAGVTTGGIARNMASKLPIIQEGSESVAKGVVRQLGNNSSLADDVVTSGLSGAGAATGQAVGGDTGELIGAVAAPLSPTMTKQGAKAIKSVFTEALDKKAIKDSAPTIDDLKTASREIYRQIDDQGVTVAQKPLARLARKTTALINREGFNARIHPKVSAVLDEMSSLTENPLTISEVDTMRKVARSAANSLDPDERRLGAMIVQEIDTFLDDVPQNALIGAKGNTANDLKKARELWGRARRSELIEQAFEDARNQASGFENGLRTQFRAILKSEKKRRGFSAEELNAMREVVRGTKASNIAKALGKFGFTEGQATSMLLSSLGVAGGSAAFGSTGAVAVPVIGQAMKSAAQRLTVKQGLLASKLIRAGRDGQKITQLYLQHVPVKQRSTEELTGLLLNQDADIKRIIGSNNKLIADAAFFASVIGKWVDEPHIAVDKVDSEEQ